MKKYIIGTVSFAVLFLAGCGTQPPPKTIVPTNDQSKAVLSTEGGTCVTDTNCGTGLKCITGKCSSGKVSSVCVTYKDCNAGLYCVKSVCSNPPSYSKYFSKIEISKMKPGLPPGPKNISVPTTEFKANTDAMEIDLTPKAGVTGEAYFDLINSTTGETAMTSADNKMKIMNGATGTGFQIPGNLAGDFELNIYFNNELIHTVSVKISQ